MIIALVPLIQHKLKSVTVHGFHTELTHAFTELLRSKWNAAILTAMVGIVAFLD
jgi:hypothetical protein